MRKIYIMPSIRIRVMESETEMLLADSMAVFSEVGINYGGVDEDGEIEADSRRGRWMDDEDWDE